MGHSHGTVWTDELIEKKIRETMIFLGIHTFPTHTEIKSMQGNEGLTNKISKTGGTKFWANKLDIPVKDCETEFGFKYESKVVEDIERELGLNSILMKPGYPYDVLTSGCVKIDTKVSRQVFTNCHTWQNTFSLEKKNPTCDIYVLYCLDNDGNYLKTIVIPAVVLQGKTQVGIGKKSKYNKYIDNWNVIEEYKRFYDSISLIYSIEKVS